MHQYPGGFSDEKNIVKLYWKDCDGDEFSSLKDPVLVTENGADFIGYLESLDKNSSVFKNPARLIYLLFSSKSSPLIDVLFEYIDDMNDDEDSSSISVVNKVDDARELHSKMVGVTVYKFFVVLITKNSLGFLNAMLQMENGKPICYWLMKSSVFDVHSIDFEDRYFPGFLILAFDKADCNSQEKQAILFGRGISDGLLHLLVDQMSLQGLHKCLVSGFSLEVSGLQNFSRIELNGLLTTYCYDPEISRNGLGFRLLCFLVQRQCTLQEDSSIQFLLVKHIIEQFAFSARNELPKALGKTVGLNNKVEKGVNDLLALAIVGSKNHNIVEYLLNQVYHPYVTKHFPEENFGNILSKYRDSNDCNYFQLAAMSCNSRIIDMLKNHIPEDLLLELSRLDDKPVEQSGIITVATNFMSSFATEYLMSSLLFFVRDRVSPYIPIQQDDVRRLLSLSIVYDQLQIGRNTVERGVSLLRRQLPYQRFFQPNLGCMRLLAFEAALKSGGDNPLACLSSMIEYMPHSQLALRGFRLEKIVRLSSFNTEVQDFGLSSLYMRLIREGNLESEIGNILNIMAPYVAPYNMLYYLLTRYNALELDLMKLHEPNAEQCDMPLPMNAPEVTGTENMALSLDFFHSHAEKYTKHSRQQEWLERLNCFSDLLEGAKSGDCFLSHSELLQNSLCFKYVYHQMQRLLGCDADVRDKILDRFAIYLDKGKTEDGLRELFVSLQQRLNTKTEKDFNVLARVVIGHAQQALCQGSSELTRYRYVE